MGDYRVSPLNWLNLGLIVFAAYIVIVDVWLYLEHRPSLSYQILCLCRQAPILAFVTGIVVGVLAGHLFWPNKG
jgi:hypothetical protein